MSRIEDTIKKIEEAQARFDALSKEEQEKRLNDPELDSDTFYNRCKIYPEEEEMMRKAREAEEQSEKDQS